LYWTDRYKPVLLNSFSGLVRAAVQDPRNQQSLSTELGSNEKRVQRLRVDEKAD
jgi:hypothetical protein